MRDDGRVRESRGVAVIDGTLALRDGRRMAYLEVGDPDGNPVLCCHGAPGSRLGTVMFDPAMVAARTRLITPDRPGYGGSDPHRGRRIEDWPDDAAELLTALGVDKFTVVGISSGGPYALAMAASQPGRVLATGLLEGVGNFGEPGADDGFFASEAALMRVGRDDPAALIEQLDNFAASVRSDPEGMLSALLGPDFAAEHARSFAEAFSQGGLGYAGDILAQAQPWGFDPGAIRSPVLIWQGDVGDMVPMRHALGITAAVPGADLRVFPGETHLQVCARLGDMVAAFAQLPP